MTGHFLVKHSEGSQKYKDGKSDAEAHIVQFGVESAANLWRTKLPGGAPCELPIEEWKYWTAFRQFVESKSNESVSR